MPSHNLTHSHTHIRFEVNRFCHHNFVLFSLVDIAVQMARILKEIIEGDTEISQDIHAMPVLTLRYCFYKPTSARSHG